MSVEEIEVKKRTLELGGKYYVVCMPQCPNRGESQLSFEVMFLSRACVPRARSRVLLSPF